MPVPPITRIVLYRHGENQNAPGDRPSEEEPREWFVNGFDDLRATPEYEAAV